MSCILLIIFNADKAVCCGFLIHLKFILKGLQQGYIYIFILYIWIVMTWFFLSGVMNFSDKSARAISSSAWVCWIFHFFIFFSVQSKLKFKARPLKLRQKVDVYVRHSIWQEHVLHKQHCTRYYSLYMESSRTCICWSLKRSRKRIEITSSFVFLLNFSAQRLVSIFQMC